MVSPTKEGILHENNMKKGIPATETGFNVTEQNSIKRYQK